MNPIEELSHFLNILLACTALAATEERVSGQDYLIQHWTCQTTTTVVQVDGWRQWCLSNGYKYMGRPFFLDFRDLHTAYYLDQFGEVMSGPGATITQAYRPPCGS